MREKIKMETTTESTDMHTMLFTEGYEVGVVLTTHDVSLGPGTEHCAVYCVEILSYGFICICYVKAFVD